MVLIKLFKALGDENRLRLVRILKKGSFSVNELMYILSGRQPNISHHLKTLLDADVVEVKKEGSWMYYRLSNLFKSFIWTSFFSELDADNISLTDQAGDDARVDYIFKKRKSQAEEYFKGIDENEEKELFDFLDAVFSPDKIKTFMTGKFKTIADIGCGNGRNLPVLAQFAERVIGIDTSARMLQFAEHICKKNNIQYKLDIGDINKLPFRDNELDAVFVNMVLHHVPAPEEALKEVARVLKDEGKIFLIDFITHHNDNLRMTHGDLWLGFTREELVNWLSLAGIKLHKVDIEERMGHSIIVIIGYKE